MTDARYGAGDAEFPLPPIPCAMSTPLFGVSPASAPLADVRGVSWHEAFAIVERRERLDEALRKLWNSLIWVPRFRTHLPWLMYQLAQGYGSPSWREQVREVLIDAIGDLDPTTSERSA